MVKEKEDDAKHHHQLPHHPGSDDDQHEGVLAKDKDNKAKRRRLGGGGGGNDIDFKEDPIIYFIREYFVTPSLSTRRFGEYEQLDRHDFYVDYATLDWDLVTRLSRVKTLFSVVHSTTQLVDVLNRVMATKEIAWLVGDYLGHFVELHFRRVPGRQVTKESDELALIECGTNLVMRLLGEPLEAHPRFVRLFLEHIPRASWTGSRDDNRVGQPLCATMTSVTSVTPVIHRGSLVRVTPFPASSKEETFIPRFAIAFVRDLLEETGAKTFTPCRPSRHNSSHDNDHHHGHDLMFLHEPGGREEELYNPACGTIYGLPSEEEDWLVKRCKAGLSAIPRRRDILTEFGYLFSGVRPFGISTEVEGGRFETAWSSTTLPDVWTLHVKTHISAAVYRFQDSIVPEGGFKIPHGSSPETYIFAPECGFMIPYATSSKLANYVHHFKGWSYDHDNTPKGSGLIEWHGRPCIAAWSMIALRESLRSCGIATTTLSSHWPKQDSVVVQGQTDASASSAWWHPSFIIVNDAPACSGFVTIELVDPETGSQRPHCFYSPVEFEAFLRRSHPKRLIHLSTSDVVTRLEELHSSSLYALTQSSASTRD